MANGSKGLKEEFSLSFFDAGFSAAVTALDLEQKTIHSLLACPLSLC
jgi:hypothetical protein